VVPSAGKPQALNRYAYALNNPVKYTDPTGHRAEDDDEGGACTDDECKKTPTGNPLAEGCKRNWTERCDAVLGSASTIECELWNCPNGSPVDYAANFAWFLIPTGRIARFGEGLISGTSREVESTLIYASQTPAVKGLVNTANQFSLTRRAWESIPLGARPPLETVYYLRQGVDYTIARAAADVENQAIRRAFGLVGNSRAQIHEIIPVKFGGDPISHLNKVVFETGYHAQVSSAWYALRSAIAPFTR
jgi:hypothetical protein